MMLIKISLCNITNDRIYKKLTSVYKLTRKDQQQTHEMEFLQTLKCEQVHKVQEI